jgi:ATP phosphoribosyltransferase regulatory subunit
MSAWVLPDHIADLLPAQAQQVEALRRQLLDRAMSHGYELVTPPLLEHLESLLTGTGEALNLMTFKLVDQTSGRTLGLRADTTPQVARVDAHLLNRAGVTRLCYCGPVAHTRAAHAHATREPLQFGAEIYGYAGREAEQDVLQLALDVLPQAGFSELVLDCADVRIVRALLQGQPLDAGQTQAVQQALARKDSEALHALTAPLAQPVRDGLRALPTLHGDRDVLARAQQLLPSLPLIVQALDDLRALAQGVQGARVSFDLSDMRGYAYYTGLRFAVITRLHDTGEPIELLRGGRYDEVGAVFGRSRPAVGFSLDIKELARALPESAPRLAIRAPWGTDPQLAQAIGRLRQGGETVICALPGHTLGQDALVCDRELVQTPQGWQVQPLSS